jgi:hypothetical protein
MTGDLWEVRTWPDGLALELCGGNKLGLVLVQGNDRVRVELAPAKAVIAAIDDAAADLA